MTAPSAFISFEMEDSWARDLFVRQVAESHVEVVLVDYYAEDVNDQTWMAKCRKLIRQTKGTLVLIGRTTHESSAVLWEIEETIQQGHRLAGVQIDRNQNYPIPTGISAAQVDNWDVGQIVEKLKEWT